MPRHLDPAEAQEVVRLASAGQAAMPGDGPTVEGLAEALGLAPAEVERLLAQVRSRHAAPPAAAPTRSFGDRSAALSAAIVLALVVVVAAVGGGAYFMTHRASPDAEVPALAAPAAAGRPGVSIDIDEPGKSIHVHGPSDDVVEPAAPAVPTTPPDPATAMSADEALEQARKGLADAKARLKDLPEAERAQAQAGIEQAEAEIAKKFGPAPQAN